jgi:hypothetical protein
MGASQNKDISTTLELIKQREIAAAQEANKAKELADAQKLAADQAMIRDADLTTTVQAFVKDKNKVDYMIDIKSGTNCKQQFTADYMCGKSTNNPTKTITIEDANGKNATFDCSNENKKCSETTLTLGDDGNLVLKDGDKNTLWESKTNTTGTPSEKFTAENSKFGRNYLKAGETLSLGEFIGSPSGNCYLIMDTTPEGNGLQLKYYKVNCDDNGYGIDENSFGLFKIGNSEYNSLSKVKKNEIIPNIKKLNKTVKKEDSIFSNKTTQMKNNVNDYIDVRRIIPTVKKQIKQFNAMNEDKDLFITNYKYRRLLWLTLAIIILLGGIRLSRNNTQ